MEAMAERFQRQVEQRGEEECWPWTGACNAQGYGCFGLTLDERVAFTRQEGRDRMFPETLTASNMACRLAHGPMPPGHHAMHACDNPPCCNPAHLAWGTPAKNAQDAWLRVRQPTTKFDDDIVRQAVQRVNAGSAVSDVAAEFGLSLTTLYRWCRGEGRAQALAF